LPEDRERALGALSDRGGFVSDHLARLGAPAAHGNRTLHVDQLFLGLPLASFEPMARSLRTTEGHGDFGGRLGLPRLARSATADGLPAFDPSCHRRRSLGRHYAVRRRARHSWGRSASCVPSRPRGSFSET
jgi:hypothetical protein